MAKGGSAPTPPDPVATAQAQTASNKETAVANAYLNRIKQVTPEGTLDYKVTGTNPDGTPIFEQYQTYSPEQQALYNQQNQIAQSLGQLGIQNISRVQQAQATPFSYEGMTPLQTSVSGGPIQDQIGYKGPGVQYGFGGYGNIQTGIDDTSGQIQRNLDFSKLTALPGTSDFSADAQRVNDAVYKQATSRLDPQFQQQQQDLASQLAAKGVTEGSDAYRNAMDQFARQRTDAYNQANYSGIQAGAQEQSRLFGLGLQARQQGVTEAEKQGQFGNTAQEQAYQQALGRGQFANQAQGQQYEQAQSTASFNNAAQQQGYGQAAQNAAFANNAQNQRYNQAQQNAALNNAGRQQQIQEATYLRNLPLNDIAALLGTGGGVQNPSFQAYNPTQVANTDTAGIAQQAYQNQWNQYQYKQQQAGGMLGSIFGSLGGIAGNMASAGMFSDRRLKENIQRIGTMASGLPLYVFNYIGNTVKEVGVMADEVFKVFPKAVSVGPGGYMMVNPQEVW